MCSGFCLPGTKRLKAEEVDAKAYVDLDDARRQIGALIVTVPLFRRTSIFAQADEIKVFSCKPPFPASCIGAASACMLTIRLYDPEAWAVRALAC
jgi:hypothetical protein